MHGCALGIHGHHAVLLPGHGHAHDIAALGHARLSPRGLEGFQPHVWSDTRAVRVGCRGGREHLAALQIDHHYFAGLC